MAVIEPCRECGVFDALGRHEGTCPRAIELGLPRLADGEEPIDPIEEASYEVEADDPEPALEPTERDPLLAIAYDQPGRIIPSPPNKVLAGLWMAYQAPGQANFDAVVFDTEIDALRYAVAERWQVMEVQLGRSLSEQATSGSG